MLSLADKARARQIQSPLTPPQLSQGMSLADRARQRQGLTSPTAPAIGTQAPAQPEEPSWGDYAVRAVKRGAAQLGTAFNVAQLATPFGDEEDVRDIAEYQRRLSEEPAYKPSASYEKFNKASGFWDTMSALSEDVPGILTQLISESMVAAAPSLALGAAGTLVGPAGTAAGVGVGSAAVETAGKVIDSIGELGYDTTNPDQLAAALGNSEVMAQVKRKALLKGVPIGVMDAVSVGIAGKVGGRIASRIGSRAASDVMRGVTQTAASQVGGIGGAVTRQATRQTIAESAVRAAAEQLARGGTEAGNKAVNAAAIAAARAARPLGAKAGGFIAEIAAQGVAGGTGEALGQQAAGEETNWPSIIAEVAAEFGTGPVELIEASRAGLRKAAQNPGAPPSAEIARPEGWQPPTSPYEERTRARFQREDEEFAQKYGREVPGPAELEDFNRTMRNVMRQKQGEQVPQSEYTPDFTTEGGAQNAIFPQGINYEPQERERQRQLAEALYNAYSASTPAQPPTQEQLAAIIASVGQQQTNENALVPYTPPQGEVQPPTPTFQEWQFRRTLPTNEERASALEATRRSKEVPGGPLVPASVPTPTDMQRRMRNDFAQRTLQEKNIGLGDDVNYQSGQTTINGELRGINSDGTVDVAIVDATGQERTVQIDAVQMNKGRIESAVTRTATPAPPTIPPRPVEEQTEPVKQPPPTPTPEVRNAPQKEGRVQVAPVATEPAPTPKAEEPVVPAAEKQPWEMTRDEFIANPPKGFLYDAKSTHEAEIRVGHREGAFRDRSVVYVGDKFFQYPEDTRKNIIGHEFAHELETSLSPEQWGRVMDLAQKPLNRPHNWEVSSRTFAGAFGRVDKESGLIEGTNIGERVTDLFNDMTSGEDAFVVENYPEARTLILELARENGIPVNLPKGAENAEAVRSDARPVQARGTERQGGQAEGGQNLQRRPEAQAQPGNAEEARVEVKRGQKLIGPTALTYTVTNVVKPKGGNIFWVEATYGRKKQIVKIQPEELGTKYVPVPEQVTPTSAEPVAQAPAVAKPAPAQSAESPQPTWTLEQWNAYREANKPLDKSLTDHLKEWVAAGLPIREELFNADRATGRYEGEVQREKGYRVNSETGMFEPPAKEQGAATTPAAKPEPVSRTIAKAVEEEAPAAVEAEMEQAGLEETPAEEEAPAKPAEVMEKGEETPAAKTKRQIADHRAKRDAAAERIKKRSQRLGIVADPKEQAEMFKDAAEWAYHELAAIFLDTKGKILEIPQLYANFKAQFGHDPNATEKKQIGKAHSQYVRETNKRDLTEKVAYAEQYAKSAAKEIAPPPPFKQTEPAADTPVAEYVDINEDKPLKQKVFDLVRNYDVETSMVSTGAAFGHYDNVIAALRNMAKWGKDTSSAGARRAMRSQHTRDFALAENDTEVMGGASAGMKGAYDTRVAMGAAFVSANYTEKLRDLYQGLARKYGRKHAWSNKWSLTGKQMENIQAVTDMISTERYNQKQKQLGLPSVALNRETEKWFKALSPQQQQDYREFADAFFKMWNDGMRKIWEKNPSMRKFIERLTDNFTTNYIPHHYLTEADLTAAERQEMSVRGVVGKVRGLKGGGEETKIIHPFLEAQIIFNGLVNMAHKNEFVTRMIDEADTIQGQLTEAADKLGIDMKAEGAIDKLLPEVKKWIGKFNLASVKDADLKEYLQFVINRHKFDGEQVSYRDANGDERRVNLPPSIINVLKNYIAAPDNWFFHLVYALPTRIFKAGTTGLSLAFGVRNPVRDLFTSLTQRQSTTSGWEWFVTWLWAIRHMYGQGNEFMQLAREQGLAHTGILTAGRPETLRSLNDILGEGGNIYRRAQRTMDTVELIMAATEIVSRATEGVNVLISNIRNGSYNPGFRYPEKVKLTDSGNKITDGKVTFGVKEVFGKLTLEQQDNIAIAMHRVSSDFRDMGTDARIANRMIPFFGAQIAGLKQMTRSYRRGDIHGKKIWKNPYIQRAGMMVLLPTLLLWLKNRDKDWYKEQDAIGKYMNWQFQWGDSIIRIPKPFELGQLFGTIPEGILNQLYQENPDEVMDVLDPVISSMLPIDSFYPKDLLATATGPVGKVIIEDVANENFFTGTPIVSQALSRRPLEEQVGPFTAWQAELLGKMFGMSPLRVEHALQGITGRGPYSALGGQWISNPLNWMREPEKLPAFGTFLQRGGTGGTTIRSINQIYKDAEELARNKASKRIGLTEEQERYYDELQAAQTVLSTLRDNMREVKTTPEKAAIGEEMRNVARRALEARPDDMSPRELQPIEVKARKTLSDIDRLGDILRGNARRSLIEANPNMDEKMLNRRLQRQSYVKVLSAMRKRVRNAQSRGNEAVIDQVGSDVAERLRSVTGGEEQ